MPVSVSEEEARALQGLNDYLSLEEVQDIYIPLIRFLTLHVFAEKQKNQHVNAFLNYPHHAKIPFLIGILWKCGCREKHNGPYHRNAFIEAWRWAESESCDNGWLFVSSKRIKGSRTHGKERIPRKL